MARSGDIEKDNLINRSAEEPVPVHTDVYDEYIRPVLAEFVGLMLFVCVGCLSVVSVMQVTPVPTQPLGPMLQDLLDVVTIIKVAFAHGLTIAFLIIIFGNISGAHLNPAVTLGALIAGAITPVKAVLYVLAQLIGGLAGAGLCKGILPSSIYVSIHGGAHTLGPSITAGEGVLCETVLTCVLVLTVLMAAVDWETKSSLAPLAVGFVVTVDILAGANISGASMNPARSFGPAVAISSESSEYWKYHYVYWVGPAIGAAVAGIWYRLFLASAEKRLILKP